MPKKKTTKSKKVSKTKKTSKSKKQSKKEIPVPVSFNPGTVSYQPDLPLREHGKVKKVRNLWKLILILILIIILGYFVWFFSF